MKERLLNYLREVRGELNRITWPGRVELIGLTTLVIIMVLVMAAYIFVLDSLFRTSAQSLMR